MARILDKYPLSTSKRRHQALKSMNSYINQLKIHYELSEDEVVRLLKSILRTKAKNIFFVKLWNIFK